MIRKIEIAGEEFGVYEVGTNFKDVAGVYAFLTRQYAVIYAGETGSFKECLSDNLATHHA